MITNRLLSKQNPSSIFCIRTRGCMKMAIGGCNFIDFSQTTRSCCNYPPAAPLAAKTLLSFTKRLPSEILEKKNAMYQRIAQPILSQVLHFTYYNFSYLKHPNAGSVNSRATPSKIMRMHCTPLGMAVYGAPSTPSPEGAGVGHKIMLVTKWHQSQNGVGHKMRRQKKAKK